MFKEKTSISIAVLNRRLPLLAFFVSAWSAPARATNDTVISDVKVLASVVTQVGSAEMRSVDRSAGYYPTQQPEIYWHDSDYRIDLQLPYRGEQQPYHITILPKVGQPKEVQVNANSDAFDFGEILSITRAPNDTAVVVGVIAGVGVAGFSIIDLKAGKLIDTVIGYDPTVSPDNRFVLFEDLFPPHSPTPVETHYRLYDVLKSPVENTCCGHSKLVRLLDDWRGQPVYPVKSGEICRPSRDPEANSQDLHWVASDNYAWSHDSSAVAFADTQGAIMSVILVTMPIAATAAASTFIYTLPSQGKRCVENCTQWDSVHLTWEGEAINATFKFTPFGEKSQTLQVTLRKTDFSPAPH